MTDYFKRPQQADQGVQKLDTKRSFSLKETIKSTPTKRVTGSNEDVSVKKKKVDYVDIQNIASQIESIPNNPTLDGVLAVLFPDEKEISDSIKDEARKNFESGFPFIIGERKTQENKFIYDKAQEMGKLYLELRYHEKWPNAGFKAPSIDKELFKNDRFFLFASKDDPVIFLGKAQEIEEKKLGLTDLNSIFCFPEYHEVDDHHYISMSRLMFSLLLEKNVIADSKGIDSSKFSIMLSEKEKTERTSDLMASTACDDGNPLFSLLLEKGVDPFRNSMLFDRTPAQMAVRDKAEKNLFLIEQFKKNGFHKG